MESLKELSKLGCVFSKTLRILTSKEALKERKGPDKLTKANIKQFLDKVGSAGEVRIFRSNEHRRFIALNDKKTLIIGMSLNNISKNEIASLEFGEEDQCFFEELWRISDLFYGSHSS